MAEYALRFYAGNSFSADWGLRILSSASPLFNPRGYHYGGVWPLFTGWAALAEYAYGRPVQGFTHITNNMVIKNYWAAGFVEEVMSGAVYRPAGVCPHQCWSETNIAHPAISGMLGWRPDAMQHSICTFIMKDMKIFSDQIRCPWTHAILFSVLSTVFCRLKFTSFPV